MTRSSLTWQKGQRIRVQGTGIGVRAGGLGFRVRGSGEPNDREPQFSFSRSTLDPEPRPLIPEPPIPVPFPHAPRLLRRPCRDARAAGVDAAPRGGAGRARGGPDRGERGERRQRVGGDARAVRQAQGRGAGRDDAGGPCVPQAADRRDAAGGGQPHPAGEPAGPGVGPGVDAVDVPQSTRRAAGGGVRGDGSAVYERGAGGRPVRGGGPAARVAARAGLHHGHRVPRRGDQREGGDGLALQRPRGGGGRHAHPTCPPPTRGCFPRPAATYRCPATANSSAAGSDKGRRMSRTWAWPGHRTRCSAAGPTGCCTT